MYINKDFFIGVNDCDLNLNITNKSILKYLEEIAGIHSNMAGYGVYDIPTTHKTWIALGWKVIEVEDGESVREISKAIASAKKNKFPTLIVVNTTIGKFSKYEGTNKIHSTLEIEDLENIFRIIREF